MSDPPSKPPELDIESLFRLGGGRISRELERFQLAREARLHAGRVSILAAAVTWVPLAVLAGVEGLAWGDRVRVPFLKDFLPYGQFLLAAPALILGEVTVGRRLVAAVAELRRSDILAPQDTPQLDRLLAQTHERWRGWVVNVVFVILTCAFTALSVRGEPQWLTGEWHYDGGRMTLAGWWYVLVSVTLLRFLVLRWVWRLMLWGRVLWRTAHLTLNIQPTHPDRAGGLAFLGATQASFGVVVFALSVQLSCLIADAVYFRGADLMSFRAQLMAFVVLVVLALLAPLLVFTPKLIRAREESLVFLSGSGYQGAAHLDETLHAGRAGELPTNDISGLADFGALYENAQRMWTIPFELRHVAALVLATTLPFAPLVFLVMPADQVLRTLAELLL